MVHDINAVQELFTPDGLTAALISNLIKHFNDTENLNNHSHFDLGPLILKKLSILNEFQ